MLLVALAHPGQETGDVRLRHLREVVATGVGEEPHIALQIPPVRRERVRGEPALDGQVVEVGRYGPRGRGAAQPSASASGVSGRACASATGP